MRSRILLGVVLLLVTVGWLSARVKPAAAASRAQDGGQLVVTTTAKREDLLLAITETGVIAAKSATPIVPEISGRVKWVSANGIIVSAGDVILRLDPTSF
jgi:multidrug resistance efflux pump